MSVFRRTVAAAAVLSMCMTPNLTAAYGGEGGGDSGPRTGGSGGSAGLNNGTTKSIVKTLTRGGDRCGRLPKTYQFDCYRWVYKRAADQLRGNNAYSEALRAMEKVEDTLEQAVERYQDPEQRVRRRALETYRPVKPASVPQVTRQAQQAMTRAETILLRSPSNKQEHYARIAEAVNSNKVLLRSALLPGHLIRLAATALSKLARQG